MQELTFLNRLQVITAWAGVVMVSRCVYMYVYVYWVVGVGVGGYPSHALLNVLR